MKASFWQILAQRKRKLLLWAFGLLLFYTVVGFLILPPIIRSVAVTQLSRQLNREVSIRQVKLNPFVLSATVRGLLIKDRDGEPFVSWDEVYVNFQLSSLFTKAWTFKEISTSRPFVRAQMNHDGTFNFSDLIEKFSTNAPAATPKSPPQPLVLHIERLQIAGATAALADYTSREPFKRTLGPLDITLDNFRTDPDNKNPYAFAGTTDAGERIAWSGFFYLSPLRSQGELTLDHLTLNKYAPLYQDLVRFEIRSGSVGVHLNYHFELSPTNRITTVSDLSFALRDFKIGRPGDTNNLAELDHFAVVGAAVDLQSRQATVDEITSTGGKLFLSRDKNDAINVVELAKPPAIAANPSGGVLFLLRSVTNAVALLLNSTNQWSGTIHAVNVTNYALHLEDQANSRPATLGLDHITLSARNISNLPGTNFQAAVSMRWNTNGSIQVGIDSSFLPPTADITLNLTNLDLGSLDPYLEPKLDLLILGSRLGLDGHLHLRTPMHQLPQVTFQGNARLDDFHTVDGTLGEDLLKWDSVRISGIDANLNPQTVAIREIAVDNAYARIVIETNHAINLLTALRMTNSPTATNEVKVAKKKTPRFAAAPAPVTTNTASASALPQISIGSIVISNAQMNFTDRSTTPTVNMDIEHASGTIDGISSEELQHADIKLHALVDGIGPADITGHINPFSGTQTNTIVISVKDVDLTPASPYAGKYAGYVIARGKLNLDLSYYLVGRKLSSKNVITLDQFTFGEKVNSPDATHLPVRLAIAILKDREGKIVLDVPVQGSIDDPQLRIGKVVTRAIVNILEKVATSPFSLLGVVFGGGGEELSYQDFATGSAELTDANRQKLDSLIKGLYARPGLSLEISGSVDPVSDRSGLQHLALEKQIRTRQWRALSDSDRNTTTPDQIVLNPEEHAAWVKKLYGEALADGQITPAFIAADTNLTAIAAQIKAAPTAPQKGGTVLVSRTPSVTESASSPTAATPSAPVGDPMELLLQATLPVGENDLETLAANRAKVVQAYILQSGKVEASRLFLTTGKTSLLRQDGRRAYLQFR